MPQPWTEILGRSAGLRQKLRLPVLIAVIGLVIGYPAYNFLSRSDMITGEVVILGNREFRFVGSLYGPGDRPFSRPLAVAAANGLIYVADSGNGRIVIYSSSGRFIRSFGDTGNSSSKLVYPTDIVVDGQGNILVADRQAGRVMVYDPQGNVLKSLPEGEDRLDLEGFSPLSLAVNGDDGITVFDVEHQRLVLFDSRGRFLRAFDRDSAGNKMNLSFVNGIAAPVQPGASQNKIYIANSNEGKILETDIGGKSFEILPRLPHPKGFIPRGLALGPDNRNLFIVDTLQHLIFRYDVQVKKINGTIGIVGNQAQSFSYPNDIFIDRGGTMYVADRGNNRIVIIEYQKK